MSHPLTLFLFLLCLPSCFSYTIYFARPSTWSTSIIPSITWNNANPNPAVTPGTNGITMVYEGASWYSYTFPSAFTSITFRFISGSNSITDISRSMNTDLYLNAASGTIIATTNDPRATFTPPISLGCYATITSPVDLTTRMETFPISVTACARNAIVAGMSYYGFRSDGLCYAGYQYGLYGVAAASSCIQCSSNTGANCGAGSGYVAVYKTNICPSGYSSSTHLAFSSTYRQYATIPPDKLKMMDGRSFSISLWLRRDASGAQWALVRGASATTSRLLDIAWFSDYLEFSFYDYDRKFTSSSNTAPTGWAWYVATYDLTSDLMKLYKNGVLVGSDIYGDGGLIGVNNSPIILGYSPLFYSEGSWLSDPVYPWFDGAMDDLRIYSRALSATEIATQYNTHVWDHTDPSLVLALTFEEGTGLSSRDVSVSSGSSNAIATFTATDSIKKSLFNMKNPVCLDVNECLSPTACDPATKCTNTVGSYTCSPCPAGSSGDGKTGCVDVNECLDTNICAAGSTCVNTIGGYVCTPYIRPGTMFSPHGTLGSDNIIRLSDFQLNINQTMNMRISAGSTVSAASSAIDILNIKYVQNDTTNVEMTCATQPSKGDILAATGTSSISYACPLARASGSGYVMSVTTCISALYGSTTPYVYNKNTTTSITTRIINSTYICVTTLYQSPTFTFPQIQIIPKTLQKGTGGGTGTNALTLTTSLSQYVSFQVRNFNPDATQSTITYGPTSDPYRYACKLISALSSINWLVCSTASDAAGLNMRFTITSGGQEIVGNDTISYPDVPVIFIVSGCPTSSGNGTSDCPTEGGILITITGRDFIGTIAVFIGGESVLVTSIIDSTKVIVQLNEGVGSNIPVVVSANNQFSVAEPLISYGAPSITSLSSSLCEGSSGLTLIDCPREGADITIKGTNFGKRDLTIFIANILCQNVTHDINQPHSLVTCQLPAGRGIDRLILVLQQNGQISLSTATISYQQCLPGSYNDPTSFDCILCPLGRFTNLKGDSSCLPCDPGYYAPSKGSSVCSPCSPGYSQSQTGQAQCDACVPGKAQSQLGQSQCVDCAAGTFTSQSGADRCEACAVGTFSSHAGASSCPFCPIGTFSQQPGSSTCEPCPPGTRSVSNSTYFNSTNKSHMTSGCIACESGSISQEAGSATCTVCPKGTYTNPSQSACLDCPDGYISPTSGSISCTVCPYGSVSNDAHTACLCGIGYYSQIEYEIMGNETIVQPTMIPTIAPTVTPIANVTKINKTDSINGTISTKTNITTPSLNIISTQTSPTSRIIQKTSCNACPAEILCATSGQQADLLSVRPGYWRSNNKTLVLYECLFPGHCRGGINSECGTQRMGPLCALCMPGYRAPTLSSACVACQSHSLSIATTVIVTFLLLVALGVLYGIILRTDRTRAQEKASRADFDALWDRAMWQQRGLFPPRIDSGTRHRNNPTHAIKIIIGFLQIITNVSIRISVPWPSAYRTMASVFTFINVDFVPWQSLGCTVTVSQYTQLVVLTLLPFGIISILACIFLIPTLWIDRVDMSDDMRARQQRQLARRKFVKLSLFTVFLMYPSISSTVLSLFACKTVEGVSYVSVDFTVICYDTEWKRYLPYTITMLLLYPIGVPVFTALILYRFRDRLHEDTTSVALGFLYSGYNDTEVYWEVLDLIHKLFLTSIIQFFPIRLQLGAGMICVIIYTILLLFRRPYVKWEDDRLHLCALSVLYLLLLGGRILQIQSPTGLDTSSDIALSILFVTLVILLIMLCAIRIIQMARQMLRWKQRKKTLSQRNLRTSSADLQLNPLDTLETNSTYPTNTTISSTNPIFNQHMMKHPHQPSAPEGSQKHIKSSSVAQRSHRRDDSAHTPPARRGGGGLGGDDHDDYDSHSRSTSAGLQREGSQYSSVSRIPRSTVQLSSFARGSTRTEESHVPQPAPPTPRQFPLNAVDEMEGQTSSHSVTPIHTPSPINTPSPRPSPPAAPSRWLQTAPGSSVG